MGKNKENSPLRAIREKCLDCQCQQPGEIRICNIQDCSLWPFRFGMMPATAAKRKKDVTRTS
jgi:hypothetical protein